MDFEQEMNGIAKAETSAARIDSPGIEKVTIKSYKLVNPKKGTPYLEVVFETVDTSKRTNNAKLYRAKEGDSEKGRAWKLKRIKELLINAGAEMNEDDTFKLKGEDVLRSIVGRTINALFKSVEKIGYNKDENRKPNIFTMIEYSFSSNENKEIVSNESYLSQTLNESDKAKFDGEMKLWLRDNGMQSAEVKPDAISEAQNNAASSNNKNEDPEF